MNTHFVVVKIFEYKNEAFGYITDFVYEVEAFKNFKVWTIRCDNGEEYVRSAEYLLNRIPSKIVKITPA